MCFLLNAQSLRKKFNFFHFEVIVQYNYPKIVFITETWLTSDLPNSLFLCHNNYSVYRKDRFAVKGGGVAILVRNDLDSVVIEADVFNGLEIVSCRIKCYDSDVIFACFYKPNISDVHLLEPLRTAIKYLLSFDLPVVLSGDFNLPGICWDTSTAPTIGSQDKFLDIFVTEGLYQNVLEPTRGSNTLDLIFTNEPHLTNNVTIRPALGFSDHYMVSFSLGIQPPSSLSFEQLETGIMRILLGYLYRWMLLIGLFYFIIVLQLIICGLFSVNDVPISSKICSRKEIKSVKAKIEIF